MKIGKALKYIRIRKGFTQKEVAGNIVTVSFLSKLENEKTNISFDLLIKLIDRMGVGIEEFIDLSKNFEETPSSLMNVIEEIERQVTTKQCIEENTRVKLQEFHCSLASLTEKIISCIKNTGSGFLVEEIQNCIIEWDYIGHVEVLLFSLFAPYASDDFRLLIKERFLKLHEYNRSIKEYPFDHLRLTALLQKRIDSIS
ncbi:helix-turn-helix domain-containing protein [Enterococcus villorum]|uniref:helix-turn-helix domain-containing protein n=1 Tax=Enterococcus villorum TaxID=112904 RepID=UPI003F899016